MTKSITTRIIYTAIVAAAIIITSCFYHFTPNSVLNDMKKNRHAAERMKITLENQSPIGSGRWVELRCKGFIDYNRSNIWWSGNALVMPGRKFNLTLPPMSVTDVIQVICKYQGSNGCMADNVKLFESPGNDNYYCRESLNRCFVTFKNSGLVEKEYIGALNQTMGYIPQAGADVRCIWIDCLLKKNNMVIGDNHCCGSECASWS